MFLLLKTSYKRYMKKNVYEKPDMEVCILEEESGIITSSGLNQVETGDGGSSNFEDLWGVTQ